MFKTFLDKLFVVLLSAVFLCVIAGIAFIGVIIITTNGPVFLAIPFFILALFILVAVIREALF